jgi:hypothetical protein
VKLICMRQGLVRGAGLAFLLFAGCHRESAAPASRVGSTASTLRGQESKPADEIRLEYRIDFPDHVKGTTTIGTKRIDLEEVVDYREEYRSWHRDGWEECQERFVNPHPSGLFTADLDIPFPQCSNEELDARNAGCAECTAAIKSLTDRYGEEAVREALQRQLEEEKPRASAAGMPRSCQHGTPAVQAAAWSVRSSAHHGISIASGFRMPMRHLVPRCGCGCLLQVAAGRERPTARRSEKDEGFNATVPVLKHGPHIGCAEKWT